MVDTIYCEKCDDFVEYKQKSKEETYTIKNEKINIDAKVAYCKECGKEIFHEELDKKNQRKVFDIYRERHNLLSPEEIKETRIKYGLNQKEVSQLLGWGEITYHRYENGAVPDSAHNNQLLLIQDPKNIKYLLKKGNTKLDQNKENELLDKINKLLDSKNKLELHLPKTFYNELKRKASNNDMELDDYASFLITQKYYNRENMNLKNYKNTIKRQFLWKLQEQETKNNWLEDLKEGQKNIANLSSNGKKNIINY